MGENLEKAVTTNDVSKKEVQYFIDGQTIKPYPLTITI